MDIMQLLFNTNHETPSGWVLAVLILLAVVIPPIMRYVAEHRNRKKQLCRNNRPLHAKIALRSVVWYALQGTAVSAIMKAEIYDVRCLLCSWTRCLC